MIKPLLTLALVGCSAESALLDNVEVGTSPDEATVPESYQLVVYPAVERDNEGRIRAFPVRLPTVDFRSSNDVQLQRPVEIPGSVTGLNATPRPRASLPGSVGPVDATVTFRGEEALEDHRSQTDEDGFFTAFVAPGAHEVFVRPASPLVPPTSFAYDVSSGSVAELSIDLRDHTPIWGRVTRGDQPLVDAPVRLVFADGTLGPEVHTDADGWYELRVTEGMNVGLRTRGSGNGIDPMLERAVAPIGPEGLRHDFAYASLPLHTVAGRALTTQQQPLSGVAYRVTSTTLFDYPDGRVDLTGFTDTNGNVTTRLLAGEYTLSLLMERDQVLTSLETPLLVQDDVDLGVLRIEGLASIRGTVGDGYGGVIQGATVSCREVGFLQRSWTTNTGEAGEYNLAVAAGRLLCSASSGDPGLATSRETFDPRNGSELHFELTAGARITGVVTFEDEPEELALIEVIDGDGNVWGSTLSDEDGAYELRLHPLR